MPLKAGTVDDFTGSMAAAMEDALAQEYQRLKGQALPDMGEEDRRMLFAAIAQGVVRHLKDNVASLRVAVQTTQVTDEPGAPLLSAENPASVGVGPGGYLPAGSVDVVQIDTPANHIRTRGDGTVDSIETEGVLY